MTINYNPNIVTSGLVHLLDPANVQGAGTSSTTICAVANESQTLSITAPDGTVFTSVEFASYGTPNGSCGNFTIGACHDTESQSIVEGYLLGNTGTITIPANNTIFGDPCSGTFKRLYVQATASGFANQSFQNILKPSTSLWSTVGMGLGNTAGVNTFKSNVIADGSGNAYVTASRDGRLETGSITLILWFNLNGLPINVGSNNNWRGLLCTANSGTAGSPVTMVLEQGNVVNISTTHTDSYRRYLNNNFAPLTVNSTGWQMIAYTYNQATGQAACYKNDQLVRSGPMTTNTSSGSPTTAGRALSYTNYASSGFRIYGGTTTSANPNGNGMVPGELGTVMIYNRALSQSEMLQSFNALKARYGL
jgi:hypothetical protein